MNGPRTNQFVAPTSFITSISRRREKIERRIVFAIRITDAIRSTTTMTRKTIQITLPTWMIRFDVCWPSFTVSTPLNFCARRSRAITFTSSARCGVISNDAGSGFEGRFAVSCGYFFCIRFSASVLETNWYSLIRESCAEVRADRVHLLAGDAVDEEDLDLELRLDVVRPRDDPACRARSRGRAGTSRSARSSSPRSRSRGWRRSSGTPRRARA